MNINRNVIFRRESSGSSKNVDINPSASNTDEDVPAPSLFEPLVVIREEVPSNTNAKQGPSHSHSNRSKKKIPKAYVKRWSQSINETGHANCIIATCNFISLTLEGIKAHYKVCLGYPMYNLNFCEHCEHYLATSEELLNHKKDCIINNIKKEVTAEWSDEDRGERCKNWEAEINSSGKATCGYNGCKFTGMNLPDMLEHFKCCSISGGKSIFCSDCDNSFVSKEEFLSHKLSEDGKEKKIHFRNIKKLFKNKRDEDRIVQPWRAMPVNEYCRRRPYTKQHKTAWSASLEKYKYVKCMYRNCYFIAMSVEDMIFHFGFCDGDGSFAKFVCPHCKGRLTSEEILQKHIERSHSSGNENDLGDQGILEMSTENACGSGECNLSYEEDGDLEQQSQQNSTSLDKNQRETASSNEKQSLSLISWRNQISQSGYAFCPQNNCNFLSSKVQELEMHLKTCKGGAEVESFSCRKCGNKLRTKASLDIHEANCSGDKDVSNAEANKNLRLSEGKRLKMYSKQPKGNSEAPLDSSQTPVASSDGELVQTSDAPIQNENSLNSTPQVKKRGRKPKNSYIQKTIFQQPYYLSIPTIDLNQQVKCGKCSFEGTHKNFIDHNLRKHVGLGWIEGETPVDLSDEKEVIRLVKLAFKLTKSATCEICQDVKRSFMGFVTHIQNCGKSEEERAALKVNCPYCPGKYLKYSLPVHIKLSHSVPDDGIDGSENLDYMGKRQSALKAVSKFQEVLKDDEGKTRENAYFLFEKGTKKLPKLSPRLNGLWYKLRKEKKQIQCQHSNCSHLSDDVTSAKQHHYSCSQLPERVYICRFCDFCSAIESETQTHILKHPKVLRLRKASLEEGKSDAENNERDIDEDESENYDVVRGMKSGLEGELDDGDNWKKQAKKRKLIKGEEDEKSKKSKSNLSEDITDFEGGDELILKRNFCRKENLDNVRGLTFYSFGLDMTIEEDMPEMKSPEPWPAFHTKVTDWHPLSEEVIESIFTEDSESIPFAFTDDSHKEINWRKFKRFEGDLIQGVPVMFTGGSVRAMSWCRASVKRIVKKTVRQYLAVSSADSVECTKDMKDRSNVSKMSLLQIWDCGLLGNALAKEAPKLLLGIVHEGGEVWDLSWFSEDTNAEIPGDTLPRLGLVVTASEDGIVRVWSICDPSHLPSKKGLPIYKTEPLAKLIVDEYFNDSCFRVSVGRNGVIAGGYANGVLAVWDLKNFSSPFCKKQKDCYIIQAHVIIQAHRTSITALTFSSGCNRYISTGGLDRVMKLWDLQLPSVPVEQFTKELCLDNIWTKNWPAIMCNFDEVLVNNNKGVVRFIKDIMMDKHQSCMILENFCLSLSFNDWLNALCACNNNGEVKVRLLKNLIQNQRINEQTQTTISSLRLQKLNDTEDNEKENSEDKSKSKPECNISRPFAEIRSEFGVVIKDNSLKDKPKAKKVQMHHEEFPIKAVNKVCFNPNFKSFTHIAVGYNLGLIRIQCLKELQTSKTLKLFFENVEREML